MHQGFDEDALRTSVSELGALPWGQVLCPTALYPPFFRFPYALPLPLGAQFRLKLRNCAQHMEHEPSGRITCGDLLIEDLEMHLLAGEFGRDLTQMQGGPCEPVETGHNERITFADVFQTCP